MDLMTYAIIAVAIGVGAPLWLLFIDRVLDAIARQ